MLALPVATLAAAVSNQTIPSGSIIHCRFTQKLNSKINVRRAPFTAAVTEPFMLSGQDVIPYGSTLEGRIADVQRPGRSFPSERPWWSMFWRQARRSELLIIS